jgi:hypothetical protein
MLRYKLRTLLILLAIVPPVLAGVWWTVGRCLRPAIEKEVSILSDP